MLLQCHDRIRHFTTVALRLARSTEASPRLITDSASALRRYFGTALPLHEQDEEDFIAPKLLERAGGKAIEHVLARMAGYHRSIEEVLSSLDDLWARVAARPTALATLGEPMHVKARSLASLFESHLQFEEQNVLPAIALLPESVRAQILREIRNRRTSGTLSVPPPFGRPPTGPPPTSRPPPPSKPPPPPSKPRPPSGPEGR